MVDVEVDDVDDGGLRDINIEKNRKWIRNRGYWQIDDIEKDCNTIIVVCGDRYKPWKYIERVCIIPKSLLEDQNGKNLESTKNLTMIFIVV